MKKSRNSALIFGILAIVTALGVGYHNLTSSNTPNVLATPSSATTTEQLASNSSQNTSQNTPQNTSQNTLQHWKTALAGVQLSKNSSEGNSSQNGAVTLASSVDIHLCGNGQFVYLEKNVSSVSVPDGFTEDLGDNSEKRIEGNWNVVSATDSSATLNFQASDGNTDTLQLQIDGDTVWVGQNHMKVSRSAECN